MGYLPEMVSLRELRLSLRYAETLDLIYMNNPKCACSTSKASLWKKIDQVNGTDTYHPSLVHSQRAYTHLHEIKGDPKRLEKFGNSKVFSVVRNPYRRAVSAYLDKVTIEGRDHRVWAVLHKRYGLRPNLTRRELPLADFMRLLLADEPGVFDPHFRPQHLNLFWGHMRWDNLIRLEAPDEFSSFLSEHEMSLETVDHHKTASRGQFEDHMDEETAQLVKKLYKDDFKYFGYGSEFDQKEPTADPQYVPDDGSVMALLTGGARQAVDDNDTAFAQITKPAKLGRKLETIKNFYQSGDIDFKTIHAFGVFLTSLASKAESKIVPREELDELIDGVSKRRVEIRSEQFSHLNPSIFAPAEAA